MSPVFTRTSSEYCALLAAVGVPARGYIGGTCWPGALVLLANTPANITFCGGAGAGGMQCLPIRAGTAVHCSAREVGCTVCLVRAALVASTCAPIALLAAVVASGERHTPSLTEKIAFATGDTVAIAAFFS